MSHDTQWPRYEVFQQAREGAPCESVGSVHAPDAEMAMQNARDVFVRRPSTVALWVVPAESILMRTAEELADDPGWRDALPGETGPKETYLVFSKRSQRRSMTFVTHVGEVEATTPLAALDAAMAAFGDADVYVWWIVRARDIRMSAEGESESMFAPAADKTFRLPGEYRTRTMMREVETQTKRGETPGAQGRGG